MEYKEERNSVSFFLVGGESGGHSVALFSIFEGILEKFPKSSFFYFTNDKKKSPASEVFENYFCNGVISSIRLPRFFWRRSGFYIFLAPVFFLLEGGISLLKSAVYYFLEKFFRKKMVILVSTGGRSSFFPVISAFFFRIPIVIHEQTSRPGLVNSIASLFAKHICISFFSSKDYFPFWVDKKSILFTGYPLRKTIVKHIRYKKFHPPKNKNSLLFLGGGNGSVFINRLVERVYPIFKKDFFIYHQTGNTNFFLKEKEEGTYHGFDFLKNIHQLILQSSCVICRSGAGIVCELIALNKSAIFFPLKLSRFSEQQYNAQESLKYIPCTILSESQFSEQEFYSAIKKYTERGGQKIWKGVGGGPQLQNDNQSPIQSGEGTKNIVSVIEDILKKSYQPPVFSSIKFQ